MVLKYILAGCPWNLNNESNLTLLVRYDACVKSKWKQVVNQNKTLHDF